MTTHITNEVEPNDLTIEVYNKEATTYLKNTPKLYPSSYSSMLAWIDKALDNTKPNGTVLELGSASPRDANYMRGKGFNVQCSDAAQSFVQHLEQCGEQPLLLNIIKERAPKKYDLIFANAVFPHFTSKDTEKALHNIYESLNKDGVLAFNTKQGTGEEWLTEKTSSERFVHYWQSPDIYKKVKSAGFDIIAIDDGYLGDPPTHTWTRIIAQKI